MRQAIEAAQAADVSLYRIAKDSGVDYAALLRFTSGQRGLNLDSAAKLAEFLNLELRPRKAGG